MSIDRLKILTLGWVVPIKRIPRGVAFLEGIVFADFIRNDFAICA